MNQDKLMLHKILGEDFVYPGHPIPIAIVIMTKYKSYKEAIAPSDAGFSRALSDIEVPGTGDCVRATMKMLTIGAYGKEIDQMVSYADMFWKDSQEKINELVYRKGMSQGRSLEQLFRTKAIEWFDKR